MFPVGIIAAFQLRKVDFARIITTEEALKPCVTSLITQTVLFAALVVCLTGIFQKSGLILDEQHARGALSSGIFFVLVWFTIGVLHISQTASQLRKWQEIERSVLDVDYLKARKLQYEKLFYNLSTCGIEAVPESLIRELEHLVMRLQFVNPIYLPILTESFLRKDFNFAGYLGKVSAKTLNKFFFMHWASLTLVLPLLALCMLSFGNIDLIHRLFFGVSSISNQLVVQSLQASIFLFLACGVWFLKEDFHGV